MPSDPVFSQHDTERIAYRKGIAEGIRRAAARLEVMRPRLAASHGDGAQAVAANNAIVDAAKELEDLGDEA